MGNLYYQIWTDAIVFEKNKYGDSNWKILTLLPISVLQGVNMLTILFWLNTFNVNINIFLKFDFFAGKMIDSFISVFISLFLPFILLNYFLIFRKGKYKKLIEKYKYRKGMLYLTYFATSVVIFIMPIIIAKWIL